MNVLLPLLVTFVNNFERTLAKGLRTFSASWVVNSLLYYTTNILPLQLRLCLYNKLIDI